jgi:rsbT antagonist protein RsbS
MEKIPVVKIGEVLLVSIQTDLHDQAALGLQRDLLEKIQTTSARGVLIDISVIDIVDSFLGRILSDTAAMAGIMNAIVVVVGIQPSVAITLVELGLELKRIHTALNVERGLALLHEKIGGSERVVAGSSAGSAHSAPERRINQNGG